MDQTLRGWAASETDPGTLQPLTVEREPLADDWVSVAVEASAVHMADFYGPPTLLAGSSAIGTVVDCGPSAGEWRDARVLVSPVFPCGECEVCRAGSAAVCPHREILGRTKHGALATEVTARGRWLCRIDEQNQVGAAAAVLPGVAATAYAMYVTAGVAPGQPVVIVGCGIRGHLLSQVALAKGTEPIVIEAGAEPSPAWTGQLGLRSLAVAPTDARTAVTECLRGSGSAAKPWYIFDTQGTHTCREIAATLAGPGATITLYAPPMMSDTQQPQDWETALRHGARLLGVTAAHPDLLPEVAALAATGQLSVDAAVQLISWDALAHVDPKAALPGTCVVATQTGRNLQHEPSTGCM